VHELVGQFHVAERVRRKPSQKLVVVPRHVAHPRAALEHAENASNHEARSVGPDEVALQLPAIDDVADEIQTLGLNAAEEVEKVLGAGKPAAEMNVGNEERADSQGVTSGWCKSTSPMLIKRSAGHSAGILEFSVSGEKVSGLFSGLEEKSPDTFFPCVVP
jgi:hypothetical protein